MKITRDTTQKFRPYAVTIQVESYVDEEALRDMTGFDGSIPNLVHVKHKKAVQLFLEELRKAVFYE